MWRQSSRQVPFKQSNCFQIKGQILTKDMKVKKKKSDVVEDFELGANCEWLYTLKNRSNQQKCQSGSCRACYGCCTCTDKWGKMQHQGHFQVPGSAWKLRCPNSEACLNGKAYLPLAPLPLEGSANYWLFKGSPNYQNDRPTAQLIITRRLKG